MLDEVKAKPLFLSLFPPPSSLSSLLLPLSHIMTALPSHVELKDLISRQESIEAQLSAHKDLVERLHRVVEARKQGNGRMRLPVELGPGFTAESVV